MDEIVLVDYDPRWPEMFSQEAETLRRILAPSLLLRVEHFGSTSVPGLMAKPIIDILAGVSSLEAARRDAVPALEELGYSYWAANPDIKHMFLVKGLPPNGPRTHHIHMVTQDHPLWERLLFSDYLRRHPDDAQRYASLKKNLMAQYPDDREAYTQGKTEFVAEVMRMARAEQ